MEQYDVAFKHKVLNQVLEILQQATLSGLTLNDSDFQNLFSQAAWLATFLANSKKPEHRRKALLFAALTKKNIILEWL